MCEIFQWLPKHYHNDGNTVEAKPWARRQHYHMISHNASSLADLRSPYLSGIGGLKGINA